MTDYKSTSLSEIKLGDNVTCYTTFMSQRYMDDSLCMKGIVIELGNCYTNTLIKTTDNKIIPLSYYSEDTRNVIILLYCA
jgi:hypothetical protein